MDSWDMKQRMIIWWIAALCLFFSCTASVDNPGAPGIDNIAADAEVFAATISFHVSGDRSSVSESGIMFGEDEMEDNVSGLEVRGMDDPSRHDYIIIRLENLKASTRYYYQVFIGNGRSRISSDILTFTTRASGTRPDPEWLELPDETFLQALVNRYDSNADGGLNPAEVGAITEIDVCDLGLTNISGIEKFPNLRKLLCSGNLIPELDISACPVLSYLDCNPMQNEARQTVLKTIWIRMGQPIEFIDKPDKTAIRIKE